jgi:xylulokinase
VVKRARFVTFIGDYLSAIGATEAGVAALARIYDVRRPPAQRECGHLLLRQLQLPELELPHVFPAGSSIDRFFRARDFGLSENCQMVIGCLDQYAGAIGTGTVQAGRVCETTGTVLAAVRCADRLRDDLPAGVIQGPAFDDQHFWQMSFSSTSANLLEWYRNSLSSPPMFDELTRLAEVAPPCDLVIEPYDDRGSIESAFRNVRPQHSPGQIVRAIMMRVALALKEQVERLCGGDRTSVIRSAGGASKNDYWLQMKADVLEVEFEAMECEEPTSLGAAMLAARAMGLGELAKIASKWVRVRKRFAPRGA